MALVLDDHLLLDHLVGRSTGWVAQQVRGSAVYTTASWYYRVANAAAHGSGSGSLSGRIASLPDDEQHVFRSKMRHFLTRSASSVHAHSYRSWRPFARLVGSTT